MGAFNVGALSKDPDDTQPIMFRPDIITFDNMEAFGKLEKTKAIFLHDQHTDALEKKNKDCMACHNVITSYSIHYTKLYDEKGVPGIGRCCGVNPFAGNEYAWKILPAQDKKKVLVIGGGPSGIQAAIIASRRGLV